MDRSQEVGYALNQTYLYVNVGAVFEELKPTISTLSELLRQLPLPETLLWCGRCNAVLTGLGPEDIHQRQQILLSNLLRTRDIERINALTIEPETLRHTRPVMPFSRGQMLELARWAALFCPDTADGATVFSEIETRRHFVAAAFIAGEILMKRLGEDWLAVPLDEALFPDSSLTFSVGAATATKSASQPWRVLGRGFELLGKYYARYDAQLDKRLRSATGLDLDEYQLCLAALVPSFLWVGKKGSFVDLTGIGEDPRFTKLFRRFAESQSQTPDELRSALWGSDGKRSPEDPLTWSLQPFRQRPIIRKTWEQAVIIDGRIWEEKIAVGALFNSILGKDKDESRHVLGAFGRAFEDYASDLISGCLEYEENYHPTQFKRNLGGDIPPHGEFEIDASYKAHKQLYVFEIKATFLREDRLHDSEMFLEHIDEKYVERSMYQGGTKRALEQLARICALIADRVWLGNTNEFSDVELIHPILVVYDSSLASPKIGEYLAERLRETINPDGILPSGQMQKNHVRISQLTLITADDLENLRDSVKHFPMSRLLSEYQYNCPTRFLSLHDYIGNSRFKDMLEPNHDLANRARETLGEIARQAFGRDIVAEQQERAE